MDRLDLRSMELMPETDRARYRIWTEETEQLLALPERTHAQNLRLLGLQEFRKAMMELVVARLGGPRYLQATRRATATSLITGLALVWILWVLFAG